MQGKNMAYIHSRRAKTPEKAIILCSYEVFDKIGKEHSESNSISHSHSVIKVGREWLCTIIVTLTIFDKEVAK